MTHLQTANEMMLVTIEEKDQRILTLTKEVEQLRASMKVRATAEVTIMALEEKVNALRTQNETLESD